MLAALAMGAQEWSVLEDMSVSQLSGMLNERGVRCVGCVEKEDFLAKLFPEEKPKYQPPSLQKVVRANTGAPADTAQLVFWGALRGVGEASKGVREAIEVLDIFVGRYLLLTTVAYVGIKFVHFKLWDPFPM